MERNKFGRLFLNYFLISWHLFAFMIVFPLRLSPVVLRGKRVENQSQGKQTLRLRTERQEKGWTRMMNQFYKEAEKISLLRFPSASTWWMDGLAWEEIYYAAEHLIIYYRFRGVMVGNRWCKRDFQCLIGNGWKAFIIFHLTHFSFIPLSHRSTFLLFQEPSFGFNLLWTVFDRKA